MSDLNFGRRGIRASASLLAASVWLVFGAGQVGTALAQDATWAGPGSEWNTGTNWSPQTIPAGTATFINQGPVALTITDNATIGTIQFNANAPAYTFNLENSQVVTPAVTINGTGIVNNSAFSPTFFVNGTTTGATSLTFANASTAGNATITLPAGVPITGSGGSIGSGQLNFTGTSTAGTATITAVATQAGEVFFADSSSAGSATITVASGYSQLHFQDTSTAGSANIISMNGTGINFSDSATAGNATITNNGGTVIFSSLSTGGNARIINIGPGAIVDFS